MSADAVCRRYENSETATLRQEHVTKQRRVCGHHTCSALEHNIVGVGAGAGHVGTEMRSMDATDAARRHDRCRAVPTSATAFFLASSSAARLAATAADCVCLWACSSAARLAAAASASARFLSSSCCFLLAAASAAALLLASAASAAASRLARSCSARWAAACKCRCKGRVSTPDAGGVGVLDA